MGKAKKTFNRKSKLPYEITIPIGDWSSDGHSRCQEITILSSHQVEKLRKAYLESVKKTGLSFDQEHGTIQVCTEYDDRELSAEAQDKLRELGYDFKKISDVDFVEPKELADMVLWFIGLSLPGFQHQTKEKTYLNGFWNKQLNVHIGYGLFE